MPALPPSFARMLSDLIVVKPCIGEIFVGSAALLAGGAPDVHSVAMLAAETKSHRAGP